MTTWFSLTQLDAIEFLRQLAPESVDLVITDPAYESLEKHRAKGTTTRLKQSDASSNAWFSIFPNSRFPELFAELFRVLKANTHCYVMCDPETAFAIKPMAQAAGFTWRNVLVWDKGRIGMGYAYRRRHEFILYFEKGKRRLNDLSVPDVLQVRRLPQWICEHCRSNECANAERAESAPTGTSRSRSTASRGSLTISNGRSTTGQSRQECPSTAATKIDRTTESRISNSSTQRSTVDSTRDVSSAKESGGNHARGAASSSREPGTTTTSSRGPTTRNSVPANPVTIVAAGSASKECGKCGHLLRKAFPTEKPVELIRTLITQSTQPGETVIDPFMGSGSTGVGALHMGRNFIGNDVADAAHACALPRLTPISCEKRAFVPWSAPAPAQRSLFQEAS